MAQATSKIEISCSKTRQTWGWKWASAIARSKLYHRRPCGSRTVIATRTLDWQDFDERYLAGLVFNAMKEMTKEHWYCQQSRQMRRTGNPRLFWIWKNKIGLTSEICRGWCWQSRMISPRLYISQVTWMHGVLNDRRQMDRESTDTRPYGSVKIRFSAGYVPIKFNLFWLVRVPTTDLPGVSRVTHYLQVKGNGGCLLPPGRITMEDGTYISGRGLNEDEARFSIMWAKTRAKTGP